MLSSPSTTSSLSAHQNPSDPLVTFHRLPARYPSSPSAAIYKSTPPAHHVLAPGSDADAPPASFKNPWPSFAPDAERGFFSSVQTKFLSKGRKTIPIPTNRDELVEVVTPDWGKPSASALEKNPDAPDPNAPKLKATWLGHSGWLLETGTSKPPLITTPSITLTSPIEEHSTTKTLTPLPDIPGIDDAIAPPPPPPDPFDLATSSSPLPRLTTSSLPPAEPSPAQGLRILLDPLFSPRPTAPLLTRRPTRYTPPPCDLPPSISLILLSHDHHDALDAPTLKSLLARERDRERRLRLRAKLLGDDAVVVGRGILFVCPVGVGRVLAGLGAREEEVVECDWWEGVRVGGGGPQGGGTGVRVWCTPAQHWSGRGGWGAGDGGKGLWCGWVVEEVRSDDDGDLAPADGCARVFFAGDTGYRSVPEGVAESDRDALGKLPRCPAFAEVGELHGPFDLALLPIGGYAPRSFLSPVQADPADAVQMHLDLRSKKTVGMHWGTVRGGVGEQYEDVREAPRRWREEAEREGLRWGEEVGLCKVGETLVV